MDRLESGLLRRHRLAALISAPQVRESDKILFVRVLYIFF
jgi:hypothetical protein